MACNIQAQEQKDSIVYRYIIAEPVGGLFSGKCKLRIDDGMNFARVRDDNDKKITFKSCAAALMFPEPSYIYPPLKEVAFLPMKHQLFSSLPLLLKVSVKSSMLKLRYLPYPYLLLC